MVGGVPAVDTCGLENPEAPPHPEKLLTLVSAALLTRAHRCEQSVRQVDSVLNYLLSADHRHLRAKFLATEFPSETVHGVLQCRRGGKHATPFTCLESPPGCVRHGGQRECVT